MRHGLVLAAQAIVRAEGDLHVAVGRSYLAGALFSAALGDLRPTRAVIGAAVWRMMLASGSRACSMWSCNKTASTPPSMRLITPLTTSMRTGSVT